MTELFYHSSAHFLIFCYCGNHRQQPAEHKLWLAHRDIIPGTFRGYIIGRDRKILPTKEKIETT